MLDIVKVDPLQPALEMMTKALGLQDWRELLQDGEASKEAEHYTETTQHIPDDGTRMQPDDGGDAGRQAPAGGLVNKGLVDHLPSYMRE